VTRQHIDPGSRQGRTIAVPALRAILERRRSSEPDDLTAAVVETLAHGVVACDADGRIVLLNRIAREHVAALGTPIESWSPLLRALRGEKLCAEQLHIGRDGAITVEVSGGPVRDRRGRIDGAVIVIQDITERAALQNELRLHSAIAEKMAEGVALVRASDGVIVYANERWEAIFGARRGELLGQHISVVNAPTEQAPEERAQEIVGALERDGVWSGEIHNIRRDGTLIWTVAHLSTFEHREHGTVWIAVQRDVTSEKAARDAVREAEERFRGVFEHSPFGIALVGPDLRLRETNRAFGEITGYSQEELTGRELPEFSAIFGNGAPRQRLDADLVTKSGERVRIALTGAAVRGVDGNALYGIAVVEAAEPG
jgi:PAS domain S-box-containing protein